MRLKEQVVQSEDQWLLARLTTDLQMSGLEYYAIIEKTPFTKGFYWMCIYRNGRFSVYDFEPHAYDDFFELTESNYTEVLTKILGQWHTNQKCFTTVKCS